MGKSLVIVESPAKAKTINRYLGDDFIVKSSVGHVRDLPVSGGSKKSTPQERAKEAAYTRSLPKDEREAYKKKKAKAQLVNRMGIDPEKGWDAHYEILPGKDKVVDELKRLAAKADRIYLATDLDREGEAIAWHLREVIGGDDSRFDRVVFNEITKKAIQAAFEEPGKLDLHRVEAQQARRFLDRVVGFMISPLLWEKIARGLSAGRVQSVAVELVVEREREIRAFIPEEFWEMYSDTHTGDGEALRLQVAKHQGENFRPNNGDDAHAHRQALAEAGKLTITQREQRPTKSRPSAPFITSTLQQAASTRLNFGVKKTMMLAQRLYEAGHITYMRTDSTNLSADAVTACREWIGENLGDKYLPEKPLSYSSKEGAQEAHEAIRPSDVNRRSEHLKDMERDAQRLYELIRRQFIACQMPPAEYLSTTLTATAKGYELKAKGRIMKFDGWTRIQPPASRKGQEDTLLPDVGEGDTLAIDSVEAEQHFTKPPARFTEASLVKELEKRGIGRPSTYAAIISTIQDRGYVRQDNRRFYAEKMGDIVTDRLVENFPNLMDYGFTAGMEEILDEIADGGRHWKDVLDEFYRDFVAKLESAQGEGSGKQAVGGMRANLPTDTDIDCPTCGRPMQIRTGSTGVFLGCSGYSLPPKERCTATLNLLPGEEAVAVNADDEEAEAKELRNKKRCPKCSTAMENYLIDEKRKLHVCGNNPDCDGYVVEQGEFRIKGYDGPTLECEKCSSEMQLRTGRFGKFFKCTNDDCGNTRKLLKNGEPAPPRADPIPMPHLQCEKYEDDHYLLRDGASGLFLAASKFPKNRETRPPLIAEIQSVAEQLDPKHKYLAEAPAKDPDGNPGVLRYSRKAKEQYVMSEIDGKATGWMAFYRDGKWVEEQTKKKAPAKKKAAAKKKAPARKKAAAKK
ncbi:DNA topoisomerase I subunit omega [Alcanivorax sp. MD8A]|uniref:DNA topoisomerase 1 n=1 Tax=Alcanivorax profundi TaxID=2338368 RepID=A0A418Y299_9GAMM|nr:MULTISPECIES: type I DNA topoisomerase [Alcanivorax]ERP92147.1 topoisomerase I [Alcanivorax sp. P2S70]PNE01310.1 DNA topoisomerase I subunit omega [Alcanivorax sp. MD8A]RJG19659.1 type I DNA topoisomerase [Alcanivorax profundi]